MTYRWWIWIIKEKRKKGKKDMCSLSNKGRRAGCEGRGRVSGEKVEAALSLMARVLFSRVHSVDFLTVAYRTRSNRLLTEQDSLFKSINKICVERLGSDILYDIFGSCWRYHAIKGGKKPQETMHSQWGKHVSFESLRGLTSSVDFLDRL